MSREPDSFGRTPLERVAHLKANVRRLREMLHPLARKALEGELGQKDTKVINELFGRNDVGIGLFQLLDEGFKRLEEQLEAESRRRSAATRSAKGAARKSG